MPDGLFYELIALSGTAAGLVLLGLSSLVLARGGLAVRLAAAGGSGAVAGALPLVLDYPKQALVPAAIVALVGTVTALLRSANVSGGLAAAVRWVGRPGVQAAGLCAAGGVLLVASLGLYEHDLEASEDADLAFMTEVTWKPPLTQAGGQTATTDTGRPVTLWVPRQVRTDDEVRATERRILDKMGYSERVIREAPPSDTCNCHGWVFTGGRYWLDPEDVEQILADNGYQAVSQPQAGDIVIYRESGHISHTAVVRTSAPGGPVLVEGKWGWMGVFLHPPEGSCYGTKLTFYHSPRARHLLAGLGDAPGISVAAQR